MSNLSHAPGYGQRDVLTGEPFTKDGRLRTGDVGRPDEGGFVHITDRAVATVPAPSRSQAASDCRRVRSRVSIDHRWPQWGHCRWTNVAWLLSRYCQCVAQFLLLWQSTQWAP